MTPACKSTVYALHFLVLGISRHFAMTTQAEAGRQLVWKCLSIVVRYTGVISSITMVQADIIIKSYYEEQAFYD
jgi:hypothetical protein